MTSTPVWVRAEIEYAAFGSYRVPDSSPSYALCSPLPSPAALRLALVDAVIRHTGSVEEGRRLFELVKAAPLWLAPPSRIAVMRFFLKRLKPRGRETLESTGSREYCHFGGPVTVWMSVQAPEAVARAFSWLRRLGTTDSVITCLPGTGNPDLSLCMRTMAEFSDDAAVRGRPVYTLHDLRPEARFEQVDPWSASPREAAGAVEKRIYVLPLVRERAGQNWVIYRREPWPMPGVGEEVSSGCCG